jgi:SAM-dependent methyltransferase
MAQTETTSTHKRRWDVSDEERSRVAQVYEQPLGLRRLARLVARNPGLAREVLGAIGYGAIDAVSTGSSVMWAIDAERVRVAVPDAASGVSWSGESRFLEPLMRHAAPGMRMLDLGCGAGRFTRHVAPVVGEVVCVDSSRMLLKEARVQLSDHPNVSYVQNRGWTLPGVEEESIDLVFSQGVFGFIGPREFVAFATETRRVLRPGGVFLFSAYTLEGEHVDSRAHTSLRQVIERGRVHSGVPEPYTIDYLGCLLDLAGLKKPDPLEVSIDPTSGYSVLASRRV